MAQKKFTGLPAAAALTGAEIAAVVQGGVSVKTTTQAIADLGGGGSGTVTSVSVTTANGVSGSVTTATTTPAISLTLGAITPISVAASGAVTGSNLSGTNTGDQTNISGNAATVTTNANLTGDVTSVGNATSYNNVIPTTKLTELTNSRTLTTAGATIQGDNLNIIYANSATPFNITVDLLAAKTQITVINKGAGTVTLIEGSGVTLVGTTIDIEEGENATIIYEDTANPDVYVSTASTGGGGSGDLTIGVSTITSGTSGNFLYNNAGLVGERTPGTGVATWFQTPSYSNLGSALTGTSLWPLLASGGTLTGVYTITSNTVNQLLTTGTATTTANSQYQDRLAGSYTLRATSSDEFYTSLINPTLIAGANSQKLVTLKLNSTYTNGAFTSVSDVALLAETGSVFIGTGIMNNVTKFSVRGIDNTSGTLTATFKDGSGSDCFTIYGDGAVVLRDAGTLRFRGNETISSPATGQLTFSTAAAALTTGAYRFRWGGSSSTSGIIPAMLVESSGSVNPTSGTGTFPSVHVTMPYNVTGGTATGISFYSAPVITLLPTLVGFKHEPTNPTNAITNLAFHAVSGQTLLNGTTVTASTTLDVRGVSSGSVARFANNSNTELWDFLNDGSLQIGTSAGTSGQVLTSGGTGAAVTWTTRNTTIVGTATNDNATAGNLGEEVNAIVSTYTNYTTTATYQNVTSITLTAGDWDLSAFMTYSSNSATITAASNAIFVISTTTASAAGATEGKNIAYVPQAALLGTSFFSESISPYRISISGTTTYYLNTQATFTLGNPQYVGGLHARRVR